MHQLPLQAALPREGQDREGQDRTGCRSYQSQWERCEKSQDWKRLLHRNEDLEEPEGPVPYVSFRWFQ